MPNKKDTRHQNGPEILFHIVSLKNTRELNTWPAMRLRANGLYHGSFQSVIGFPHPIEYAYSPP
jgi:hypothetical protein